MKLWLSGVAGAGKYAEVDAEDYVRLNRYKWFLRNTYAVALVDNCTVRMHRMVMNEDDPRVVIDHANRNRLDNRSENLRRMTPIENANNRVDNVRVEAFGEELTIGEWARDPRCGVSYDTLQKRIYRGYPPEVAILALEEV